MNNFYLEKLSDILTEMLSDCKTVRNAAKRSPMNRLMITFDHGKLRFAAVGNKDGRRKIRYLDPDSDYVYRMANAAFGKELCRRLSSNAGLLETALRQMESLDYKDILQVMPRHFELLDPRRVMEPARSDGFNYPNPSQNDFPKEVRLSLGNMDPWEWAAASYCENTSHLEHKIHPTAHGINCRSKSEALLFEIYDSLEIPFHYDEVILIGGVKISPDLIGARRDGSLVFHEHRGLMTEEYLYGNDWKAGTYSSAGIIPGKNMIYTYDSPSGTLNTKLAREIIRDIYRL